MKVPDGVAGDRDESIRWTLGEAAAVVLVAHATLVVASVVVFSSGGWSDEEIPTWAHFLTVVPFWAVGVLMSSRLFVRSSSARPAVLWRSELLGDQVDSGARGWIGAGVVGALAGAATSWVVIPVVYAPLHQWWGTTPDELERLARETVDRADGSLAVVLLVVMTCIGAPVAEEVMYRGVLQPALERWGVVVSIAGSSAVFALAHFQTLQLVGLFLIGVVLGILRWRSRGLLAPILGHMAFNLVTVVALLAHP